MTEIAHSICRFIAVRLQALSHWDKVYAVCFKNAGGEDRAQIERYPYPDDPNPSPLIVGPLDGNGTYVYIREMEDTIEGSGFSDTEGSCLQPGAMVRKKFRAVAVSDCIRYSTVLASKITMDIMRMNFCDYKEYEVTEVDVRWVGEQNGINRLFKDETGIAPKSEDVQLGALDFEVIFRYIPVCTQDQIELC
jgi:hypothetical protein